MNEPVFIEPIVQRDIGDCAIACLAMLVGKSYPEVVAAAPARAYQRGMHNREVVETAAKFGIRLIRRRKFDPKDDIGILILNSVPPRKSASHAVLLLEGQIYDAANGRLWLDVDVYFRLENWKPGTLLTMETEK